MLGDEIAVALLVVVLGEVAGELGLLAQALADQGQVGERDRRSRAKWVRARRSGCPAFDDSDRVLPGLDVDVGRGVGGTIRSTPGIETAATSPTKAVPLSSCR